MGRGHRVFAGTLLSSLALSCAKDRMDTESFMLMRLLDGRVIRELVKDSPPPG
jgi:hypothetical protein